jgi:hypothetical protein
MSNTLAEMRTWASTLLYWEQAALDKVVAGVPLGDKDYEELLQYLLEDGALAAPSSARPTLRFPQAQADEGNPTVPVRLVSISGLHHVNALVPGQTLTFGPALTAIYGENGSGKSGYARVLACAGFTRGDQEVLPDVTKPTSSETPCSAEIAVEDAGETRTFHYEIGQTCPCLASLYVFDSTSVRAHLTKENEVSFSPAGLSHLTQLAEVTDEVRKRLQQRVSAYQQPHSFTELFAGDSKVKVAVNTLGASTNLEKLRSITLLSPEQQARLGELDLEIAELKVQNTSDQIADIDCTLGEP